MKMIPIIALRWPGVESGRRRRAAARPVALLLLLLLLNPASPACPTGGKAKGTIADVEHCVIFMQETPPFPP